MMLQKWLVNILAYLKILDVLANLQLQKNLLKININHILVYFSKLTKEEDDVFENINDLDFFFLRLQTVKGRILKGRKSVIIFDEIQFAPKIRRAIKHLVKDGRYDYIETGSLISIKKNVKNILIPSEKYKIDVYPMDYEEFCWACGYNYNIIEEIYKYNRSMG